MTPRSRLPAALCAWLLLVCGCARQSAPVATATPTPTPTPAVADPLNGVMVAPAAVRHRIAAVMIDNYPDARPQSGLYDADVVYEVEAEGGITRYMALYLGDAPAIVGPVRSARTYFVDLARPYDPFFAHAGQNDDTIEQLAALRGAGFSDMDEIQHTPEAFWRDDSRDMPHNLYTGIARMRKVGPSYGYADRPYQGDEFAFAPASATSSDPADVVASFWLEYDVHFVWDGAAYQRFIDGQAQHDRDDDRPYRVRDIIAVWIPARVLDAIGDLSMDVYGRFPAVLVRDGRATPGLWDAQGPATLPQLNDEAGAPLALTPGQIYVEVMPQGSSFSVGKQVWSH
ncbi:MAG: DUF3048 domain-containing protein [Candidatus Eremiobacteraeota bacterium]|nr:DUF3048 domain-containing protein [Candidatus Eremiobacteraeota bacterium]